MVKYTNLENRLSDDKCAQINKELVNSSVNDRTLYNYYYTHDCKCSVMDDTLFDNNFTIKDGFGFTNSCVVDLDSELRINTQLTHDKGKIQLCARSFEGGPNLNKGGFIPNIESRLRNGDNTSDIRACDIISEKSYIPLTFSHLMPCVASVQDPKHIVEPWTRGGDMTRDFVRTNEYLEKCGFTPSADKKNWVRKETTPINPN